MQDLGFLACTLPQVAILMPTKKPRGEELTLEQQLGRVDEFIIPREVFSLPFILCLLEET